MDGVRFAVAAQIFFCSTASRPSQGHTHPPIKFVPVSFSGSKAPGAWSWHNFYLFPMLMVGRCPFCKYPHGPLYMKPQKINGLVLWRYATVVCYCVGRYWLRWLCFKLYDVSESGPFACQVFVPRRTLLIWLQLRIFARGHVTTPALKELMCPESKRTLHVFGRHRTGCDIHAPMFFLFFYFIRGRWIQLRFVVHS
jgi:hypothetical protein